MASKYQIIWRDVDENLYQVDISNANYVGTLYQLEGYAVLTESATDLWQAIRSRSLTLYIRSSVSQSAIVDQLFDEEDRYFTVFCTKNSNEIFRGSLATEDVEQPFNSDTWEIAVECRDALGFLEELPNTCLLYTSDAADE